MLYVYSGDMIKTADTIVNPIEFLRENIGGNLLNEDGWQIVSGADYDVLVQQQTEDGFGATVESVTPVYDRLYPRGLVKGAQILGHTVKIEWYLSPAAANNLSLRLGRIPTVDVLEFTHTEEDEITMYRPFIGRGQYPQSTGRSFFTHDRYRFHAPGIWLMTAGGVQKLKSESLRGLPTPISLDGGTNALLFMAENLLNADFDIAKIETQYGYASSSDLLGCKRTPIKLIGKSKVRSGETEYTALAEHMQQSLLPAVRALLPTAPPLQEQALAIMQSLAKEQPVR